MWHIYKLSLLVVIVLVHEDNSVFRPICQYTWMITAIFFFSNGWICGMYFLDTFGDNTTILIYSVYLHYFVYHFCINWTLLRNTFTYKFNNNNIIVIDTKKHIVSISIVMRTHVNGNDVPHQCWCLHIYRFISVIAVKCVFLHSIYLLDYTSLTV